MRGEVPVRGASQLWLSVRAQRKPGHVGLLPQPGEHPVRSKLRLFALRLGDIPGAAPGICVQMMVFVFTTGRVDVRVPFLCVPRCIGDLGPWAHIAKDRSVVAAQGVPRMTQLRSKMPHAGALSVIRDRRIGLANPSFGIEV